MLRELDVPYVALVPGSSYRGLHDSIVNLLGNKAPQMVLCVHEETAVAIAHGYAKVTDKIMASGLHANIGLMRATMAIYKAWCDRAPVLVMGATGPVDATKRRPWIDWIHTSSDQGGIIRNFTKWDNQLGSPAAAVESLARAAQIAQTAPKGPVYVNLDVAMQEEKLGPLPDDKPVKVTLELPAPLHRDLVAYAEVLSARSHDYVEAVRALGAPTGRILLRTVLPNIAGPVLVQFSLAVAAGCEMIRPAKVVKFELGGAGSNLLELLESPFASRNFDLHPERIGRLRRHTHDFLMQLERIRYDYWEKIPVLIDWNLGNFSVAPQPDGTFRLFSRWDYDWFRIEPRLLDFYFLSRVSSKTGDRTQFTYGPHTLVEPTFIELLRAYRDVFPLTEGEVLFLPEVYRFFILNYVVREGAKFFRKDLCRQFRHDAVRTYLPSLEQLDTSPLRSTR